MKVEAEEEGKAEEEQCGKRGVGKRSSKRKRIEHIREEQVE